MCLALPGQVVDIVDAERHLVVIDVDGARKQVSTAMLEQGGERIGIGDWLEVHLGMAFARIDEEQAREILEMTAFLESDEPPPELAALIENDPAESPGPTTR